MITDPSFFPLPDIKLTRSFCCSISIAPGYFMNIIEQLDTSDAWPVFSRFLISHMLGSVYLFGMVPKNTYQS